MTQKLDYLNRPTIEHNYESRPSWRRYGTGFANVKITVETHGALSIIASEYPEEFRGGKEVMVCLSPEKTFALYELLKTKIEELIALGTSL